MIVVSRIPKSLKRLNNLLSQPFLHARTTPSKPFHYSKYKEQPSSSSRDCRFQLSGARLDELFPAHSNPLQSTWPFLHQNNKSSACVCCSDKGSASHCPDPCKRREGASFLGPLSESPPALRSQPLPGRQEEEAPVIWLCWYAKLMARSSLGCPEWKKQNTHLSHEKSQWIYHH